MRTSALRHGTSLVELLAVLTLTSLIGALLLGVCLAQMRLARAAAEHAVSADAARTAVVVLSGEARRMAAGDVRAVSDDSLAIRAFRGTGIVCGSTMAGVLVRYTGDRLPEPSKDSVLIGSTATTWSSSPLLASLPAPGACLTRAGETVMEWRLAGGIQDGAVLPLFESGSYHLTDGALRYRLGAAGRQPITADALRHPDSRFLRFGEDAIHFGIGASGMASASHAAFFGAAVSR